MKSKKVLDDFVRFCKKNKDLRFWQALSAWTGEKIVFDYDLDWQDTYFFEGKDK